MRLNSVDLPAPFGPISPISSLAPTAMSILSSTTRPPNRFWTASRRSRVSSGCIVFPCLRSGFAGRQAGAWLRDQAPASRPLLFSRSALVPGRRRFVGPVAVREDQLVLALPPLRGDAGDEGKAGLVEFEIA